MTNVAPLPVFRPADHDAMPESFLANVRPDQDVLVVIHGISRNAAEMATRFAGHPAFARTTIIAPLFTPKPFGKYQQMMTRKPGETASDGSLIALLDALAAEQGMATGRVRLFGFSGGAQMAHRFAMFHPTRVSHLCIASAGWYCMPRTDLAYPFGIGNADGAALVGPDFLDIPTTVVVGNRDTRVDDSVRQDPEITENQGRNRLRRARCFVRAMNDHASLHGRMSNVRLLTLPDVSHDFTACANDGGLIDVAAEALL
jgi:pimeloyl-ACP methyl ester carboxylesterase